MQELNVLVTLEAVYDILNAEEYIRNEFGEHRALKYRDDIQAELEMLSSDAYLYASSGFVYRGYTIYKKPYSPAIIFWIVVNGVVHVLRIPREEYDWQHFFETHQNHEYRYPNDSYNKNV